MKRFLFTMALVFCLSGCDKIPVPIITDWAPVNFYIKVVDANGEDLLDPLNDNTWVIGTTLDFMGSKDTVDQACLDNINQTKYYMPHFDGVRLVKSTGANVGYVLAFGEFDGADSYDNEKLTITWPDGESNIITYKRKFNLLHTDVAQQVYKLDGKECSNPIIIIKTIIKGK